MRVRYAEAAQRDLIAIAEWGIAVWGDTKSESYIALIERAVDTLTRHPEIGPAIPNDPQRRRRRVVGHHILIYRSSEDAIEIIRIYHASNVPDALR